MTTTDSEMTNILLKRVNVLNHWRVKDFDLGQGAAETIMSADLSDQDWIDAALPGDIYQALHTAGRLPDPFGDRTEEACAWVKDREWWWCADFEADEPDTDERLRLILEGLDTFATIWLNDHLIGSTDNMFLAWSFDIGQHVVAGVNRLAIRFTPTSAVVVDKKMPLWSIISDPIDETKRNFVRKAQFGWGWDWAPRLPTIGPWRPVILRVETKATIDTLKFSTPEISLAKNFARVAVELSVDAFTKTSALVADIILRSPSGEIVKQRAIRLSGTYSRVEFEINNPKLWWTPELGTANLHSLSVALNADGKLVDSRTLRVGIRKITLDTSSDPDEPGTSFFRFVLNGVPLFARGACWIPASSFVGAVDKTHYRRLLDMAVDANMNMIRIWGGGVYEHDAFYDRCDELGLLVWQDFMFACAPYPEHDPAFISNVRAEVRYQIKRLRHHASLALWCGNNEGQAVQGFMNRLDGRNDPLLGSLYYDRLMPEAVGELDSSTPYWPGSPTGGPSCNSMLAGDIHSWTVWHGLPPVPAAEPVGDFDHSPEGVAYTRYAEDMGRFISEYGIQASPVMETLRRVLPEDQRVLGSPGLLNRIKDRPKDKVDAMMTPVTGLPKTLDEYVDFTQITQAEGLKFGIEHFRRRKPHCSGSLIWQYNDCWPGISWSLVDYYGFPKAAYYYTRRAYAPVLASFKQLDDGDVELWIINDTPRAVKDDAIIELGDFHDGTIWSEVCTFAIPANSSQPIWRGEAIRLNAGATRFLHVQTRDHSCVDNRLFFSQIKDLDRKAGVLPAAKIEASSPHELHIQLTAPCYLYFVHVLVPHEDTRFSDNYFDMRQGETCTIIVRNDTVTIAPEDLQIVSR